MFDEQPKKEREPLKVTITNTWGMLIFWIIITLVLEGYNIRRQLTRIADALEEARPNIEKVEIENDKDSKVPVR